MLCDTAVMLQKQEFSTSINLCPPAPFCQRYFQLTVTVYNNGQNFSNSPWLVRVDELSWNDHEGAELEILSEHCIFSEQVPTLVEARNLFEYKCLSSFSKVMSHKVESEATKCQNSN